MLRKTFGRNKGITLIALVVTIIVLLILAGISISLLSGQNGILNRAVEAKKQTESKSAEEKVKMAVMSSMTYDGTLTLEKLKTELANYGGKLEGDTFPVTVTIDENIFKVNINGEIKSRTQGGTLGSVDGTETSNTTVQDALGNQVVVPAGFKIVNQNDYVTDGIIIEDTSNEITAGSQFIWIPVGNVILDSEGNTESIMLGRYVFDEDGTVNSELSKTEPDEQVQPWEIYFTEGLKESSTENTHAKDIMAFRSKTISNHGYYIGRYEARTAVERKENSELTKVTEINDGYVYNWVTQPEAAEASREMYNNSNFESDLTNSYAWDTALLFLQKFDNRENKENLKPYSRQVSLNGSLSNKGTNNLTTSNKQDVICNIYDMASNCFEWSTETTSSDVNACTFRGGSYSYKETCPSERYDDAAGNSIDYYSFRPILYLND